MPGDPREVAHQCCRILENIGVDSLVDETASTSFRLFTHCTHLVGSGKSFVDVAASVGNGGNKLAVDLKLFAQPRQIHAQTALLHISSITVAGPETAYCLLTGDR